MQTVLQNAAHPRILIAPVDYQLLQNDLVHGKVRTGNPVSKRLVLFGLVCCIASKDSSTCMP